MKTKEKIKVDAIVLLFLCKTATKKTLDLKDKNVLLNCELDENYNKSFFTECYTIEAAKELHKQCVEWLNY